MSNYAIRISIDSRPLLSIERFPIEPEQVTFLFGESGIGKSIACKAVYGLLDPDELTVTVNGRSYRSHLRDSATLAAQKSSFFVFQEPSSHLNPLMRIGEQLSEGDLRGKAGQQEVLGRLWENATGDIQALLSVYPKPYRPSGGEKQRILLAMAFKKINLLARSASAPEQTLFVFDEPTGSLDNNYRNLFVSLLMEKFAERPFTALVITHDYSIISEIYARHRPLLDRIRFKEFERSTDTRVTVRDFSPKEYLDWLALSSPPPAPARPADPVLVFEPRFRVFGRSLCLFTDSERTQAAPLTVRRGEMVYVKAPSGVGKTTLAKVILGMYRADEFAMTLAGAALHERSPADFWPRRVWGRSAGMVFQHADEALNMEASVLETFRGIPLKPRLTAASLPALLSELFDTELSKSFLNKKVKHLSGGQKQRLNLLRTFALHTDLIIMDEPLNALDFGSVKKVLRLIEEKRRAGSAILMISHNEEIFDSMIGPEHVYYLAET